MSFEDNEEREETLLDEMASPDDHWDPDPSGYYAALGISLSASPTAVRKAFLRLSQIYHTDKHSGASEEVNHMMNERFQKLQEAYSVLSNERQRVAYDASGQKGIDRLALVPQNVNRSEDIVRYLATLEREAELHKVAKMLSASSTVELSYSIAHLFISRARLQQHLQHPKEQEHSHFDASGELESAEEASDHEVHDESKSPVEVSEIPDDKVSDAQTETTGGTGDEDANQQNDLGSQVFPRQVVIDGKTQIVLIPSEEVQMQIWKRMTGNQGVPNSSPDVPKDRSSPPLSLVRYGMLAAVPKSVTFFHSFQHQLSPTLNLTVVTEATQRGTSADVGCGGIVEYWPDGINTHKVSCHAKTGGLRIKYTRTRVLNALWTLRAKVTCLHGFTLLEKYELALTRKLSKFWELENALVMSLTEHGMFRSTFLRKLNNGVQGIKAHIGFHNTGISIFDVRPVVYGDDIKVPNNSADEDNYVGGSRGFLRQTLTTLPFAGKTELSFQAWYRVSKWYSVGIGFGTFLPYALSPVMPVTLFVKNPQPVSVNQFSLLYARGNHTIRIPVIAFASVRVQHALLWMGAPIVMYRLARHIWRPFAHMRIALLCQKNRKEHQTEMDIARGRAIQEQRAVETFSIHNRSIEERIGGLVILNAKYGVLQPRYIYRPQRNSQTATFTERVRSFFSIFSYWRRSDVSAPLVNRRADNNTNSRAAANAAEEDGADAGASLVLDVTVPLQNFVQDSRLVLPEGSKSKLVGFTDPDPFTPEQKQLKIVYWFRRRKHMVVVNENDPVEIPLREHLVDT